MKFILLGFSCFVLFQNCKKDSANDRDTLFLLCAARLDPKFEYTQEDNGEGALYKVETFTYTQCGIARKRVTKYYDAFVKKCLQGQVYRKKEQDCKGTGTAPDWGAIKFQICPSADRSCDRETSVGWIIDKEKSPAAISCANDNTAGKKWFLPGFYNDRLMSFHKNISFWLMDALDDAEGTHSWYYDPDFGNGGLAVDLKTSYKYVVCYSME